MKRLCFALALAVVPSAADSGRRCTIVTDGSDDVYWHEYAHCLGWNHPTFQHYDPPSEYRGMKFKGKLKFIDCGWGRDCNVGQVCYRMWRKRGVDLSSSPGPDNITGCSFDD